MKISTRILLPHVYLLNFETQHELCLSFVRMQEFYESPKFKGRYFTLEKYIDYWCREFGKGAFTYLTTWAGFNVPGKVMYDWTQKFEKDISKNENEILESVYKLMRKEMGFIFNDEIQKVYIIGTYGKKGVGCNDESVEHELSHALYRLFPEYKKGCRKLLRGIPSQDYGRGKMNLIEMGYCNKMIEDELQAYFSTSDTKYGKDVLGSKLEFVHYFNDFKNRVVADGRI